MAQEPQRNARPLMALPDNPTEPVAPAYGFFFFGCADDTLLLRSPGAARKTAPGRGKKAREIGMREGNSHPRQIGRGIVPPDEKSAGDFQYTTYLSCTAHSKMAVGIRTNSNHQGGSGTQDRIYH